MKIYNRVSILKKVAIMFVCVCMIGCRVPHDRQLRRITWDETERLMIISNDYAHVTVSEVRVDTLFDSVLDLKLKFASLLLNRRWAVNSAVVMPSSITAIKLNGMVIPLSELRVETAIENDKRVEEIILRPRRYPSTFKFKYYPL